MSITLQNNNDGTLTIRCGTESLRIVIASAPHPPSNTPPDPLGDPIGLTVPHGGATAGFTVTLGDSGHAHTEVYSADDVIAALTSVSNVADTPLRLRFRGLEPLHVQTLAEALAAGGAPAALPVEINMAVSGLDG